eukprot:IDg3409t1
MDLNGFRCVQCGLSYGSTTALGRHCQSAHRRRLSASNTYSLDVDRREVPHCTSSHVAEPTLQTDMNVQHFSLQSDSCIADEVIDFYESLNDTVAPLFTDATELPFPFESMNASTRRLFEFCCVQKMTRTQIASQYELHVSMSAYSCHCNTALSQQFPTKSSFVRYVSLARKHIVSKQKWQRAVIHTRFGVNSTGVFRSAIPIIIDIVNNAGGLSAVTKSELQYRNGDRVYSSPMDSDSMYAYKEEMPAGSVIIGLDLFSDGTTVSNSGSQSLCLLRMRVVNVQGVSDQWHEIGIEPIMTVVHTVSASILSEERSLLKQRFLYQALKESINASRSGFLLCGSIAFIRINTLVCDQKEERAILALRSQGSYRDCTHCLMPSLPFPDLSDAVDMTEIPSEALFSVPGSVFNAQIQVSIKAPVRNVENTLSRQVIVARAKMRSLDTNESFNLHRSDVAKAKNYLKRTSASSFPPALGAMYGLGTRPYHLYKCVGFDKLHTVDLGTLRLLPDHAFTLFNSIYYHKGVYSGRELVRIANSRFRSLQHLSSVYILPFRRNSDEKHASMTGKIRRKIAPFLWVTLLGLQPGASPDHDVLLQSALALDRFQTVLRGVNMCSSSARRTATEINAIQHVAFHACLWLAHALAVPISTKLHRSMRHVSDALFMFGCSRRGDSDSNETLHKATKNSISASNRKLEQIASQVLLNRSIASFIANQRTINFDMDSSENGIGTDHELEDDLHSTLSSESWSSEEEITPHQETHTMNSGNESDNLIQMLQDTVSSASVDTVNNLVGRLRHIINNNTIWTPINRVRFATTLTWITEEESQGTPIYHVAYAGNDVLKKESGLMP